MRTVRKALNGFLASAKGSSIFPDVFVGRGGVTWQLPTKQQKDVSFTFGEFAQFLTTSNTAGG